jgi:hypothetical protein
MVHKSNMAPNKGKADETVSPHFEQVTLPPKPVILSKMKPKYADKYALLRSVMGQEFVCNVTLRAEFISYQTVLNKQIDEQLERRNAGMFDSDALLWTVFNVVLQQCLPLTWASGRL